MPVEPWISVDPGGRPHTTSTRDVLEAIFFPPRTIARGPGWDGRLLKEAQHDRSAERPSLAPFWRGAERGIPPAAALHLVLIDGSFVPAHFHVTEAGRVQKDLIDCGGTTRSATTCVLQVRVAGDTGHRLDTTRLAAVMRLAAPLLKATDLPVEVEYEGEVVSQFTVYAAEVTPSGVLLHLGTKHPACLAMDRYAVTEAGTPGCASPGGF